MSNTSTSAAAAEQPYEVDGYPGVIRVNSDGSIWTSSEPGVKVPVHDDGSVVWKDVLPDSTQELHLCLYKPASPSSIEKRMIFPLFEAV